MSNAQMNANCLVPPTSHNCLYHTVVTNVVYILLIIICSSRPSFFFFFNFQRTFVTERCTFVRNLIPFGVGHRSCMGVSMTYDRMFLLITTLLQHHELAPPSGQSLPTHDPRELIPGTVLQAPSFLCRVLSDADVMSVNVDL